MRRSPRLSPSFLLGASSLAWLLTRASLLSLPVSAYVCQPRYSDCLMLRCRRHGFLFSSSADQEESMFLSSSSLNATTAVSDASFGESVSIRSRPAAQETLVFESEELQESRRVDPAIIKRRNLGVALASVALAVTNYLWQWTHPITPVQLLMSMQQQSAPLNVIGRNDKPTVVDFWAPWCENCKLMAPTLLQVEEEYKDRVNFVMINGDLRDAWPYIDRFGVDAIPHISMISAQGDVETALIGPVPKSILEADLDVLIQNQKDDKTAKSLPYKMLDVFSQTPELRRVRFDEGE